MQDQSALKRINAVKEVLGGKSLKEVSKKYGCTRQSLYLWLKKYKKEPKSAHINLKNSYKSGRKHYKTLHWNIEKKVLDFVIKEPQLSVRALKAKLGEVGIKVSLHGVYNILVRFELQTEDLRHRFSLNHPVKTLFAGSIVPAYRVKVIEEHLKEGKKISQVCRSWKISRVTFYAWLNRYKKAVAVQGEEANVIEALARNYKNGWEHHRSLSESARDMVRGIVIGNPGYSVHKIYASVPKVDGKPVVGHHGIQNILAREDLNTYEKRLRFAQGYSKQPEVQIAPLYIPQIPLYKLRHLIAHFATVPKLLITNPKQGLPSVFVLLSSSLIFILWIRLLATTPGQSPVGLFFASIALLFGLFFFIYSMKYYISTLMVLKLAQSGAKGPTPISTDERPISADSNINGQRSTAVQNILRAIPFLGRVEKFLGSSRLRSNNNQSRVNPLLINLEKVELKAGERPFVSIHAAIYNEKRVVERLIRACEAQEWREETIDNSQLTIDQGKKESNDQETSDSSDSSVTSVPSGPASYEVIIADDSTDETYEIAKQLLSSEGRILDRILNNSEMEIYVSSPPVGSSLPVIKLIHRFTRSGFKGGALQKALENTNPKAQYITIFDADFVPYPDTIEQFIKTFQVLSQNDERLKTNAQNQALDVSLSALDNSIAAVQGYQWHVLNKSQNWVTRGVRTEYAGSYVVERAGEEIYGGLKQIAGSVYMIRADILRQFGWGKSITEDFELTLRLYEAGYKVAFTPYIQAPAEAVSTLKRLIRQRMRWAEGASFNIKVMLGRMLWGRWETAPVIAIPSEAREKQSNLEIATSLDTLGTRNDKSEGNDNEGRLSLSDTGSAGERRWVPSRLSRAEKLEFAYLAPYYLQAAFFVIGTFSWFISETIIGTRLPFWTAALGWSLVFTNLLALPLMNIVGMFLEESDERDYIGILSFIALSYIVVPFQAYAAIKGFLETEEGPWFRTPKTGLITDTLGRSGFSKFFGNILGRPSPEGSGAVSRPAGVPSSLQVNIASNGMLMASAQKDDSQEDNWGLGFLSGGISAYRNFSFAKVPVPSQRRVRWVGKLSLVVLIVFSLYLSPFLSYLEPKMNSQQKEIAKTALNLEADNGTFAYNQNPAFTLKIDDKVIKRPKNNSKALRIPFIKDIFAADFEVQTSLSLGGEPVDIKSKAMEEEDGTFKIELDSQERTFKPGKYTLAATVVSGKERYETSQDFSWGVLVINTNKDSYELGEEIKFGFGVLNDMGQTICDANLKLVITVPSDNKSYELSTDNGQIKPSGECTKTSATNTADYLASFTAKDKDESYGLRLEAQSANGVKSVRYPLKVKRGEPFTVERVSYPTRFYPPAEYEAKLIVHANQDFKGKVSDLVPESFEISKSNNLTIEQFSNIATQGDKKVISFDVNWEKGSMHTLGYTIKFPKESPQFYFVGPLRLVPHQSSGLRSGQALFEEARMWQIAADAPGPTVVTSIPRATHSISSEQVGGTNAHIVTINNPVSTQPDYKWQFLTGGTRLFIDRKAGAGWVQLVSQIQTAPEYMKQQGAPGNFVWNPYGLNINTTGANVLQGFDRQEQANGSTKLVRTYSTFEEGIAESLSETWTIPKTTEDLAVKGPKATYSMTKNRGIVVTKGVNEGTWRMRWAISGIADITVNNSDIKDNSGWPIRKKSYANGDFVIDVDDFDNIANDINAFSFSEIATNNKAEILFFKNGTTGGRVVDPTIVLTATAQLWLHNRQRNVQYNGSNWFVFYNKGSTSLFARAAGAVADLDTATEQTALNALMVSNTDWDIYWVTDAKFDIVYKTAASDARVQTCTVLGTTIDCTTLVRSAAWTIQNFAKLSITRTRSANRVWLTGNTGNSFNVAPAGQTGDSGTSSAANITSWGNAHNSLDNADGELALIPFNSADTVLAVHGENPGGTNSDGIFSYTCTQAGGCGLLATVQKGSNALSLAIRFGNGFWVSDTDLRFVYVDVTATNQLIEATHNGGGPGTWTITEVIDTAGGQTNPSAFYDSQENLAYVFYADSASPKSIQRYRKPTASTYSTNWDSKTDVDDPGQSDDNSLPVTQMHEPPLGATQTRTPRELSWCWRNVGTTNFDLVCDNFNLAVVPENIYILAIGGPVIFMAINRMKKFARAKEGRKRRKLNER